MVGPSFIEDVDAEHVGDFLDQIDDLLDFSNENIEGILGGDDLETGGWPIAPDSLAVASSAFSDHSTLSSEGCLPTELDVPCDDILQLEWLSNFVDDSFSAGNIDFTYQNYNKNNSCSNNNNKDNKKDSQFQTSSPISVLETSSNSSSGKILPPLIPEATIPGRARSKRPRPASFCPRPITSLLSPATSSETDTPIPLLYENFAESESPKMISKKKKSKPLTAEHGASRIAPVSVRKCLHCQIEKTPQWRLGPMGPKTLCNACGVRYKSGRLFPEYRPAASPTFVASVHSNSHKKVLEMRTKKVVTEEKSNRLLDYLCAG